MAVLSSADRDSPWYRDGLGFRCTNCGDCCRGEGYVWVDEADIEAIARFLDLERDDFGRQFLRKVGNDLSLIDNDRQECIFWDKGCTIYPVRPTQCRTFPFWRENLESPAAWATVESTCPGAGTGRLYDLIQIGNLQSGNAETSAAD